MYSNMTENLNRPLCGSMAYASGFSVAVNELCEPSCGHLLHMYPICWLGSCAQEPDRFFYHPYYPELRSGWHCEMAVPPLTTAANMPFAVCVERSCPI